MTAKSEAVVKLDEILSKLELLHVSVQDLKAAPKAPVVAVGEAFPNYGKAKGAPIRGATQADLLYYRSGAERSLNDPDKARWHDKERRLLEAIDAELQRQGFGIPDGEAAPF